MNLSQNKINKVVEEYKGKFQEEFIQFSQGMQDSKELQKDALASTGTDGAIQQLAYEIPVTLDNMFKSQLDKEESLYFKSKAGAEWFGRTHKEFSPAEKI